MSKYSVYFSAPHFRLVLLSLFALATALSRPITPRAEILKRHSSFWRTKKNLKNKLANTTPVYSWETLFYAGYLTKMFYTGGENQYLICNILRGGTLLQPWPNAFGMRKYFSEDYVIPSPKLKEDQKKKVFAINWSVFSPKMGEDQKKKVFTDSWSGSPSKSVFPRNLVLYSAGICRSCLPDHPALKSRCKWWKPNWWKELVKTRILLSRDRPSAKGKFIKKKPSAKEKMSWLGGVLSKLVQRTRIIEGSLGAKPAAVGRFLWFFAKTSHFSDIQIKFRTFWNHLK